MKWMQASFSFFLVAIGVFFITGWCTLPDPLYAAPELTRVDRVRLLAQMDWIHNWWGYCLGPLVGACSAWLTIRKADRKSVS